MTPRYVRLVDRRQLQPAAGRRRLTEQERDLGACRFDYVRKQAAW